MPQKTKPKGTNARTKKFQRAKKNPNRFPSTFSPERFLDRFYDFMRARLGNENTSIHKPRNALHYVTIMVGGTELDCSYNEDKSRGRYFTSVGWIRGLDPQDLERASQGLAEKLDSAFGQHLLGSLTTTHTPGSGDKTLVKQTQRLTYDKDATPEDYQRALWENLIQPLEYLANSE